MTHRTPWPSGRRVLRRRGAALVFTTMSMVVLVGMAALTIDVGYMYSARVDLQNAADAAALTAATAYASEAGLALRSGSEGARGTVEQLAWDRANNVSQFNPTIGRSVTSLQTGDLSLGHVNISSTEPLDANADVRMFNAVHVLVRRDASGPNGAVELFFSRIFGYTETAVTASAVAAFDDHVAVVAYSPFIPFTMDQDLFQQQLQGGPDEYEFDSTAESVLKGADDIREIRLFPNDTGAGNFGLLNIGPDSSSATQPNQQIGENILAEHMETTFGTSDFHFLEEDGTPASYEVPGTPGLKSSLEGVIQSRVGEVVGIFLHDEVEGNGSNLSYNVVGVRFVRIMAVNLSGNPKYLSVQPVVFDGERVLLAPNAPSTDGLIGNIVLAR